MPGGFSRLIAWTVLTASAALGGGACDLESLRSNALYPRQDAAAEGGATADATPDNAGQRDAPMDVQVDLQEDLQVDVQGATGMLSGTVRDSCSVSGTDALIGIGGRHTCSFKDKGSYFFARLPVGTLKLTAAKMGYALYEATVVITAGGNIHDIQLGPVEPGGCAAVPMPPVACSCTTPTCEP